MRRTFATKEPKEAVALSFWRRWAGRFFQRPLSDLPLAANCSPDDIDLVMTYLRTRLAASGLHLYNGDDGGNNGDNNWT
jgi:hypothetical protein